MIPRLHRRHTVANCFHDARSFVPEHHRKRVEHGATVHDVQVRPADAGCNDAHEHLARARRFHVDLLERGGTVPASHDDGSSAHGVTSTAGPTIERS